MRMFRRGRALRELTIAEETVDSDANSGPLYRR
jgi:hypothetical protein